MLNLRTSLVSVHAERDTNEGNMGRISMSSTQAEQDWTLAGGGGGDGHSGRVSQPGGRLRVGSTRGTSLGKAPGSLFRA